MPLRRTRSGSGGGTTRLPGTIPRSSPSQPRANHGLRCWGSGDISQSSLFHYPRARGRVSAAPSVTQSYSGLREQICQNDRATRFHVPLLIFRLRRGGWRSTARFPAAELRAENGVAGPGEDWPGLPTPLSRSSSGRCGGRVGWGTEPQTSKFRCELLEWEGDASWWLIVRRPFSPKLELFTNACEG